MESFAKLFEPFGGFVGVEDAEIALAVRSLAGHRCGADLATPREAFAELDERRLQWDGRLAVPGMLTARHTFTIEPRDGGSRLEQHETFTGLLVPFVRRSLDRHTLPAFIAMNAALKAVIEWVPAT